MSFTLPALPFAPAALEPHIDAKTMEIHHGKHHQAYITNLNNAVAATPALQGQSLEDLLATISQHAPVVRNNAGGHWNHSFFWNLLSPTPTTPSAALSDAIASTFGSLEAFKEAFEKEGLARFGSGWVWLVKTPEGKLVITSTPNQDNPLMDSAPVKGTPILGNDVWEHAYYLHYQNRRADYLKAFWNVLNWHQASAHFGA